MARPKVEAGAIRETLLLAAERRLRRLGTARFSVTDLAADCRMSQSNVYRFIPNKAALMAALAERWFAEIEAGLQEKVSAADSWQTKLKAFVRVQRDLKAARYDADPDLFRAYLTLAGENPEAVGLHVAKLQSVLEEILGTVFEGRERTKACELAEDATQLFRDPFLIARLRPRCTAERADAAIAAVIATLERQLENER
ncbi:TetR/AcrR family transcriptional regulator [Roseibium sp. M-1]